MATVLPRIIIMMSRMTMETTLMASRMAVKPARKERLKVASSWEMVCTSFTSNTAST